MFSFYKKQQINKGDLKLDCQRKKNILTGSKQGNYPDATLEGSELINLYIRLGINVE